MEYLDGRFTGYDPYVYYRQAERIVEEGRLPKRDMERWLPFGRDLSLLHNLYSYALAYSYRAVRSVAPRLTLYEFSCYAPPVLFAATAALFMAVLWTLFGWEAAGLGCLFLIFTPSVAFRTPLGFGDRDAFCLFLGVLTSALYLWQAAASKRRHRRMLAAACGFTACLGCLAWEGSGVFALCVLIPATVGAWRSTDKVMEFYVFAACLTLPLLLFSSAHRFWVVPTEPAHPVGLVAVFPALLAASMILIRQAFRGRQHTGLKLASFLPAALLVGFLLHRALSTAESALSIAVPFSGSRLMLTIGEVYNMDIAAWRYKFGALPLVAAGGVVGAWLYQIRRGAASFPFEMLLFGTAWIGLWGFLTQISLRYSVMLAPAVAAWSGVALIWAGNALANRYRQKAFAAEVARYLFATVLPILILFWRPVGGLTYTGSIAAAPTYAQPSSTTHEALRWMSQNLDRSSGQPVVAAGWLSGVHLNVLADAATIEDTDTWKHYWVHLSSRHLFCAENETEALRFLKTRNADYWMLTSRDLSGSGSAQIEQFGSGAIRDRNIEFSQRMWNMDGSKAFELVFENAEIKLFRIHYPPDLTVPPELYEAWTAPDFPDPELRRVWMGGG